MYNANDAKADVQKAKSVDGDYKKEETLELLHKIKCYAIRGDTELDMSPDSPEYFDNVICSRLKELGYEVNLFIATNPREESRLTISWKF